MLTPRRALISLAVILAALALTSAGAKAADDEVAVYKRAVDAELCGVAAGALARC